MSVRRPAIRRLLLGLAAVIPLQTLGATGPEAPRDFSGVWLAFASEPVFDRGNTQQLTDEGQNLVEAFRNQFPEWIDPGSYCVPPGMPATMTSIVGYPIEILHSDQRLTILAELEMQVRRIFMDGREIPENYPTAGMGYSVGHWEGNSLVIETGLLNDYLTGRFPRTEETHIVERVTKIPRSEVEATPVGFITTPPLDDQVLAFELTVSDPTLYPEPVNMTVYYQRIEDVGFLEYGCIRDIWEQAMEHGRPRQ